MWKIQASTVSGCIQPLVDLPRVYYMGELVDLKTLHLKRNCYIQIEEILKYVTVPYSTSIYSSSISWLWEQRYSREAPTICTKTRSNR